MTRQALAEINKLEEKASEWTQAEAPILAAEQRLQLMRGAVESGAMLSRGRCFSGRRGGTPTQGF